MNIIGNVGECKGIYENLGEYRAVAIAIISHSVVLKNKSLSRGVSKKKKKGREKEELPAIRKPCP